MSVMIKNGAAVDEVTVKAASTAALAADKALVVAIHPSTNPIVVGTSPHSSAASGNPVRVAGKVNTSVETTLITNDVADIPVSSSNAVVVTMNNDPATSWSYTGSVVVSTDVAARTAGASGVRNYVTDLQLQNTGATPCTFTIKDGSTVIWQCSLPASMTLPIDVEFNTPKRGTAATALNFNCSAASTVLVNIGGFQAA